MSVRHLPLRLEMSNCCPSRSNHPNFMHKSLIVPGECAPQLEGASFSDGPGGDCAAPPPSLTSITRLCATEQAFKQWDGL